MQSQSNRGGARKGAGRKTESVDPQRRRNVMLTDADYARAKAIGNGNASAGLRKALASAPPLAQST